MALSEAVPVYGGEGAQAPADDEARRPPEDWTSEERRDYRLAIEALRARQRRAGRAFALTVIALVGCGIVFRVPESWWVPAVGAAALLGLAFRLVNWKCPRCGERLPTRGSLARCLGCGAPLDG
jgi:hypothetical protein